MRILAFIINAGGFILVTAGVVYIFTKEKRMKGLGIFLAGIAVFAVGTSISKKLDDQAKIRSGLEKTFIDFIKKENYGTISNMASYKGDVAFKGENIGKSAVAFQTIKIPLYQIQETWDFSKDSEPMNISHEYDDYIPEKFQPKNIDEMQSVIFIKNVRADVGTYSSYGIASRIYRYIFVLDKNTKAIIASKRIILEPPKSITYSEKDRSRAKEEYDKKDEVWNNEQLGIEKAFFQSLYRKP